MRGQNNLLKKKGYREIYDLLQNHPSGMTARAIRENLPHLTPAIIGGACTVMHEYGIISRLSYLHEKDGCRYAIWGPKTR
ncbi:MAG: hypothetical protein IJX35_00235 [Candidatus Methanomethylophilaceae archaeon]|nr:hypothetical protein [Candidatus Methanomethylophilaceae archaeon]